jgi:glutamine amidotransferase
VTAAKPNVVVLDYGSGNVHSAAKALERAGAEVTLTSDKQAALEGVQGGEIVDHRLAGGRPVLGICVGMQVLFSRGIERGADVEGLGQWPGTVQEIQAEVLPHMGWNTVQAPEDSVLFDGLHDERFYFVHSYGVTDFPLEAYGPFRAPRLTWAEHGQPFIAAVENGPLTATQFHPEKSGEPGIRLLSNWVRSL